MGLIFDGSEPKGLVAGSPTSQAFEEAFDTGSGGSASAIANTKAEETRHFPDATGIVTTCSLMEGDPQLKQDVFNMLCSGWSPARISKHLLKTGAGLSVKEINAFLNQIPITWILPVSHLRKALQDLDVKVDAVGQMERLLRTTEDRLSTALLLEDIAPSQDGGGTGGKGAGAGRGITIEATRMTQMYWQMLREFVQLQQSIGDMPSEPVPIDVRLNSGTGTPTLRDLLAQRVTATSAAVDDMGDEGDSAAAIGEPPSSS